MHIKSVFPLGRFIFVLACIPVISGCEGWDRKHDYSVVDVTPPADDLEPGRSERARPANFADMVEKMMETRQVYLDEVKALQRAYLNAGDTVRANWCRRVAFQLEDVVNYPFLSPGPAEQRAEVMPERPIPEADKIYNEAYDIYKQVAAVPLAGALEPNKDRARKALGQFKRVLRDYPNSDKVDECAFYCGEIYKEYLREEDPDDELSVRYYQWAFAMNPQIALPARFQAAVVYDFRRHDRARAIELYHQVMELEEAGNQSNVRFSATRVEQLTDEQYSHLKPEDEPKARAITGEPRMTESDSAPPVRATMDEEPLEPQSAP
ncbi:MAG: hypothetical protein DCC65_07350 [Planctomycetota bacterium]|nr:MAG: hypothetical protein DCC65_07350 [Planctomycetota bacterium]